MKTKICKKISLERFRKPSNRGGGRVQKITYIHDFSHIPSILLYFDRSPKGLASFLDPSIYPPAINKVTLLNMLYYET